MTETCCIAEKKPAHEPHVLEVKNLHVQYRKTLALRGINFSVKCGTRVALLGANGAGKSTLLKAIAGLIQKNAGEIMWRGGKVAKWSREFAYLPQREEVDWSFPITVRGMVEMGRYPQVGWWRKYTDRDHQAVEAALASLDLLDLQDRQICELSGGQQQRAFLARAVAQEAHVLLLDEPFTGLDRTATAGLASLLEKMSDEGRLVIASHHELSSVGQMFHQALLLAGEQIAFGTVDEVVNEQNLARVFPTNF